MALALAQYEDLFLEVTRKGGGAEPFWVWCEPLSLSV